MKQTDTEQHDRKSQNYFTTLNVVTTVSAMVKSKGTQVLLVEGRPDKNNGVLCSAVQFSAVHCRAVQCSTVQCSSYYHI